jgi:hypothetical protein
LDIGKDVVPFRERPSPGLQIPSIVIQAQKESQSLATRGYDLAFRARSAEPDALQIERFAPGFNPPFVLFGAPRNLPRAEPNPPLSLGLQTRPTPAGIGQCPDQQLKQSFPFGRMHAPLAQAAEHQELPQDASFQFADLFLGSDQISIVNYAWKWSFFAGRLLDF